MTTNQYIAQEDRHSLRLAPPLADEFSVYGGADTVERARAWALDHHYLLALGVPKCAHGLYLLANCPGSGCRNHVRQLDHTNLWVPASPVEERPFLLCHPYSEEIDKGTYAYAAAHGLRVNPEPYPWDAWYGFNTIPIRMTVPDNWPVWPIEAKALVLLAGQPVAWPEDDEAGS